MNWLPNFLPDTPMAVRVIIASVTFYALIIIATRVAGKRSVSKMNSFDWIVTVALGSIVAAALIGPKDLGPGIVAALVLIGLQWLLTLASLKSEKFRRLLKNNPTLLVRNGEIIQSGLDVTHVDETEILAAARGAGLADMRQVKAMILETDGSFSVIAEHAKSPDQLEGSTLRDLSEIKTLADAGG